MSAADVLREARNMLFERGWCQGQMRKMDGSLCSLGALFEAKTEEDKYDHEYIDALAAFSYAIFAPSPRWISTWNDQESRTFDQVVDAFDRAEKIAERRETER